MRKNSVVDTIAIIAVICTIILICVLTVSIIVAMVEENRNENLYAINTVVMNINSETDEVFCIDKNGNIWSFYGTEDWAVNDNAILIMIKNKTETIYDDEIISAIYSRFFENNP